MGRGLQPILFEFLTPKVPSFWVFILWRWWFFAYNYFRILLYGTLGVCLFVCMFFVFFFKSTVSVSESRVKAIEIEHKMKVMPNYGYLGAHHTSEV